MENSSAGEGRTSRPKRVEDNRFPKCPVDFAEFAAWIERERKEPKKPETKD